MIWRSFNGRQPATVLSGTGKRAVTVHSAQGVTADTTHAVLGETTGRSLLYVAMTRGRDTNTAYLYERTAGEGEHEHPPIQPRCARVARCGTSRQAAHLVRAIIATRDEQARTAHHIAAETPDPGQLPDRVQWVLDRRAKAVATRRNHYQAWCRQAQDWDISRDQQLSRSPDQSRDYGLDL